jgi:hypothetical protein
MTFRIANIETTGADHLTVQSILNAHGAQCFEHYQVTGIVGYFRQTDFTWEYNVVTLYGNSDKLTEILNEFAKDGWQHYLTIGSRGFFKRPTGQVTKPLPVADSIPMASVPSVSMDRTGIPQSARINGKRR